MVKISRKIKKRLITHNMVLGILYFTSMTTIHNAFGKRTTKEDNLSGFNNKLLLIFAADAGLHYSAIGIFAGYVLSSAIDLLAKTGTMGSMVVYSVE
jgi:hypothetical protein